MASDDLAVCGSSGAVAGLDYGTHSGMRGYELLTTGLGDSKSTVAPVATLVSPIGPWPGPSSLVVFDLIDMDRPVNLVLIECRLRGLRYSATIYAGDGFRSGFAEGSSRVAITNGWRFTLIHDGGWPGAPSIVVYADDADGVVL